MTAAATSGRRLAVFAASTSLMSRFNGFSVMSFFVGDMYAGFLQLLARVFSVSVLPVFIGEYGYYVATVLAWVITLPVVMIPYYRYLK